MTPSYLVQQTFINILETCRKNNDGLNSEKLQLKQEKMNVYKYTLTEKGIQPAEDKTHTIKNIKVPANTTELHTILGMVNYLNRFSMKLAEYTACTVNKEKCVFQMETTSSSSTCQSQERTQLTKSHLIL